MSVKKFQTISKLLSIFCKLIAILFLIILVFGSLNLFINQEFSSFSLHRSDVFSIVFSDPAVTEAQINWAASIMIPISLASLSYLFFKASYLFDYLAEGKTPFTYQFSNSLKIMGFLLIAYNIFTPLLYSLFVNIAAENGRYFYFSLASSFFAGLILYLVSGIINYGINLENRSDALVHKQEEYYNSYY